MLNTSDKSCVFISMVSQYSKGHSELIYRQYTTVQNMHADVCYTNIIFYNNSILGYA